MNMILLHLMLHLVLVCCGSNEWEDAPPEVQVHASVIPLREVEIMLARGGGAELAQLCGSSAVCADSDLVGKCSIKPYRRRLMDAKVDGLVECESGVSQKLVHETRFFREEQISSGQPIYFPHLFGSFIPSFVRFLPSSISNLVPFSLEDLPDVFSAFGIQGSSLKASMVRSIQSCNSPPSPVEQKACITSMKAMHDFITLKLGKSVRLVASSSNTSVVHGTIVSVERKKLIVQPSTPHVSCHKLAYPYLLYYCHTVAKTSIHRVKVVGKAPAAVANVLMECHYETGFYKDSTMLQNLHIQPNSGVPFCHFNDMTTLVFVKA